MESDFIDGIQEADIFLHANRQAAERGSKILATMTRAICPENGLHGLTVESVGRSLIITASDFPNETFILRTTLSGVDFIRRNDRRHDERVVDSSDFKNDNIFPFMRKLGRYLRFIDSGFEPVEIPFDR